MKGYLVLLLTFGAQVACVQMMGGTRAWATGYCVDCNYVSNVLNVGTSAQAAWRTPLVVTQHSPNPRFLPGRCDLFQADRTRYEGVSLTSSVVVGRQEKLRRQR